MDDGRWIGAVGLPAVGVEVARPHAVVVPRPTPDVPPPGGPSADDRPDYPRFAAPALVLLAAVAVFEGYMWLHLIPGGSLRPSGLLFAVAIVPVTFALTRSDPGRRSRLRRFTRLCSVPVPLLGLAFVVSQATPWARLLGAVTLALAVSALVLAVMSEHRAADRSSAG